MFDRIVVVDWSAQATPKSGPDSIWICTLDVPDGGHEVVNHRTRRAASDAMVETARRPGRTLIGFDFPFGYPVGFAAAAGLRGDPPWDAMWRHLHDRIEDDHRNRNNRWAVAADLNARMGSLQFWGSPPARTGPHLTSHKPPTTATALPPFRHVEIRLRSQQRYPFSVWQLLGAGSVGSQALTGIPVAQRLRTHPDLAARLAVWPFETGLVADPTAGRSDVVVLAEVWPSATTFDHVDHPVKDARQVIALAQHFATLAGAGTLGATFTPALEPTVHIDVCREEGWVLGVS